MVIIYANKATADNYTYVTAILVLTLPSNAYLLTN